MTDQPKETPLEIIDAWADREGMAAGIVKDLEEQGYVIVPKEPTRAMSMAGFHAHHEHIKPVLGYTAEDGDFKRGLSVGRGMISSRETDAAYRAMVAIAVERDLTKMEAGE